MENLPTRSTDLEELDDACGAELDIEAEFRRKIAGLRRLPRADRPHALKKAKEARDGALKALQERRVTARKAKYIAQKEQGLAPN